MIKKPNFWESTPLSFLACYGIFVGFLYWLLPPLFAFSQPYSEIAKFLQEGAFFVASPFIVLAVVSWIRSNRYRRLLWKQKNLESLRSLTWRELEKLMVPLYQKLGYQVRLCGGAGGDGGIDLILHRRRRCILVQCKHWRNVNVGVAVIRELRGVMATHRTDAGIVVTTGKFSKAAIEYAGSNNIELVNGYELLKMIEKTK